MSSNSEIKIKTRADALKYGIHKEAVGAFRLHNGDCPVGIVTSLTGDHFTVALFSWLIGYFSDELIDIAYQEVHSVIKGTYTTGDNGRGKVFQMDALGDAQTAWAKTREEIAS